MMDVMLMVIMTSNNSRDRINSITNDIYDLPILCLSILLPIHNSYQPDVLLYSPTSTQGIYPNTRNDFKILSTPPNRLDLLISESVCLQDDT